MDFPHKGQWRRDLIFFIWDPVAIIIYDSIVMKPKQGVLYFEPCDVEYITHRSFTNQMMIYMFDIDDSAGVFCGYL